MRMDNWAGRGLVQANNGRLAGSIVDGHNVKAQRALYDMALAKEIMRGANEGLVLFLPDAQFGKRELAFTRGERVPRRKLAYLHRSR
jgi:hypothetical protein